MSKLKLEVGLDPTSNIQPPTSHPPRTSNLEPRTAAARAALAPLAAVLLAVALRLANDPLTVDDAYITFRYARNIAEGLGFVYNSGEAVLGTTTPLWTLLLAALHRVTAIDLPTLAMSLNAAFDGASAWLLFVLVRRVGGSLGAALAASLLFAAAPMSVAYAAGGMESSLFVLLVLTAGVALSFGRPTTAAAAAGLATLARPEGLLLGALLLADYARRRRGLPLKALAAYLAPLAPWLAYATLTFGSPLPQSMAAKAGAYQAPALGNLLALWLQPGLPGLSLFLLGGELAPAHLLALVAASLAACLIVFGVRALWAFEARGSRFEPPFPSKLEPPASDLLLPFALFPACYVVAYALAGLRGVRLFHWYLVPLVPFYCILLALAAQRLGSSRMLRGRAWPAYAALAVWWLPGYGLLDGSPTYPFGFSLERERLYTQVAADYGDAWSPSVVVAAPEIGALGFYSHATILDTVGLVSPEAARFHPLPPEMIASDNAVPPALLQHARPDYVVSLDQFVRRSLLPDRSFQESYELLEARPARIWDSRHLLVYRRAVADAGEARSER